METKPKTNTIASCINELIDKSNYSILQKGVFRGFVSRADDFERSKNEDRDLVEAISLSKNISQIVLSTEDVKIYTVRGSDEWDVKCPFRSIFKDSKGEWRRVNTVSPTLELAFLTYLEHKCLGENSQFVDFAMKMLEIKIEE